MESIRNLFEARGDEESTINDEWHGFDIDDEDEAKDNDYSRIDVDGGVGVFDPSSVGFSQYSDDELCEVN